MRKNRRLPKMRNRTRARAERVETLERRCLLATITVNTAVDNTNPNTTLSLRQAIEISNGTLPVGSLTAAQQALVTGAVGASNTIDFLIPTTDPGFNAATGVWTIHPAFNLPPITTNIAIIDGYSQTGASKNTLGQADNAVIKIAIDGTGLGALTGLTLNSDGSSISGLDIEHFGSAGVALDNIQCQVSGCFIGTDTTGETAAPNGAGVVIQNSTNTVGGTTVGDRNIISGNSGDGIDLSGQAPNFNVVAADFIGIDSAGTTALGNTLAGVRDAGTNNTYGSTLIGNVISGNGSGGIKAAGSITVQQSNVGTNAAGTAALGNGPAGIGIQDTAFPSTQTITTRIIGNIVSGNHQSGIDIGVGDQATSTYTITQNQIGTDVTGNVALGNTGAGVILESVENTTFTGNQVSGNIGSGIQLTGFGPSAEHNIFQGNKIGSNLAGTAALGNTGSGFLFSNAVGNTIGGSGAGQANVIAFNGAFGIDLTSSGGGTATKLVQISENSIFGNTERGIELGAGGTNNFVTPPTLAYQNGMLTATYTGGPANQDMLIEVFSNPTHPTPGVEQGKTFVNSFFVTTNGSGNGTASKTEPTAIYTATGTDDNFNTSEFSNAVGGQALPATTTTVTSSLNPSTFGQSVTFKAVVAVAGQLGAPTGTVIFTIDGTSTPPIPLAVVGGVDQATFTNATLGVGQHSVSAAYSGTGGLAPSSGTLPTQVVTALNTSTLVTSTLNPATAGQAVTFIANVVGSSLVVFPTGTVVFTIDGHAELPVPLTPVGETGQAEFTTSTLTAGVHTVSATYGGNAVFAPSSGSLPTQTVIPSILPSTMTVVTSSLNPSTFGQAVTFGAVVTVPVTPAARTNGASPALQETPTGTVTFIIDGHAEPPVPLAVVGDVDVAFFSTSSLAVGAHSVAAYYGGSPFAAPSGGALPTETVVASASSVVLTAAPNPSSFGDAVVLTAAVTSSTGGAVGGTVAFVEGTTVLGFAAVGPNGHATLALSSLPVGSTPITAIYSGDAGHSQATSNQVVQVVEAPSVLAPTVLALRRYGFHAQPTILSLAFSTALEAISAQDVRNYRIALLNAMGRPVRGHTIAVRGAIYNPFTITVTLVPAQRLNVHYRYALTVNGTTPTGVRGASGLLLDGNGDGKPGSNYVAEVNLSTLAGPAPGFSTPRTAAAAGAKHVGVASASLVDRLAVRGELAALASRHRGW